MRLDQVFPRHAVTASPDCDIATIVALMEDRGVGTVVITVNERPVGIVTDRDLALELGSGRALRSEPVRIVMTQPVSTIGCHEGIFSATRKMRENCVRRLPIVDEAGRAVGVVSLDDLLILLSREMGNLASSVDVELTMA